MPTYEYECRICQHRFEKFQSISEDPLRECPACGGAVRRVIGGGSGIIFKGPGFYVTDSKRSSPSSSKAPASSSAPASASQSESSGSGESGSAKSPASSPAAKAPLAESKKASA
ncbi:MAG TPA: FmdB family zinc ribbon protein [Rectinemataceae bacterium]